MNERDCHGPCNAYREPWAPALSNDYIPKQAWAPFFQYPEPSLQHIAPKAVVAGAAYKLPPSSPVDCVRQAAALGELPPHQE